MENIVPAVQKSGEKSLKELSPNEFQQVLSGWFQEKGIVQDMKSYLKFQMINVLKNTAIGKNISKNAAQTSTLAQQALHLIVAEYLLHHQCHYALSLFSTEVNLSNILPETKLFLDSNNVLKKAALTHFDKENLINILELIGIPKHSQNFSKIIHDYFSKTKKPLLPLLVNIIGNEIVNNASNEQQNEIEEECEDDFMKNVSLILKALNLPHKTYLQLLHNLSVCYDLKMKQYESQFVSLVNKFKKDLFSHEQKLHHCQKRKKCLEKRLERLREENVVLKKRIEELTSEKIPTPHEKIIEKTITLQCSLCHCNEECTNVRRQCDSYKREIVLLKKKNDEQRKETDRLTVKYEELLRDLISYTSKINLVSERLQEDMDQQYQNGLYQEYLVQAQSHMYWTKGIGNYEKLPECVSVSSESITEEILKQAKLKLRLLEEESEELDLRFSNIVIK